MHFSGFLTLHIMIKSHYLISLFYTMFLVRKDSPGDNDISSFNKVHDNLLREQLNFKIAFLENCPDFPSLGG